MINDTIRIGTRGSKLALYQAYRVQNELQKHFPETKFTIEIIKTKGDKILDVALSKIGDKGLFTKEIEEALFNGEIDMAVHSLKDLPTRFPEGATLGAVLERGDIRDALISLNGRKINDLTADDVIATSSLRRKAQLLRINKDFQIIEIRGNVNTRIRKMEEGYCNVMVMAGAGLQRLEMDQYVSELFDPETLIPACSQGAIAVEIRDNDSLIADVVSRINHSETYIATKAERTFLGTLEGGCQIPVGSYTKIEGEHFKITGFISSIDGTRFIKDSLEGDIDQADFLAAKLANILYQRGGEAILKEIRNANEETVTTDQPLKGKVIITTRATEPGDSLPGLLKSLGADLIPLPMIEIVPAEIDGPMREHLHNLDSFDWIFFTSKNGVSGFFKHLIDIKGNTNLPSNVRLAAIGLKTGLELEFYGYAPEFISDENTSEEFLKKFSAKYNPEKLKILLSLGNLADDFLYNGLSGPNFPHRINVYQTVRPQKVAVEILDRIKQGLYDLIIFTSPSTFHNFCSFYDAGIIGNLKAGSIGNVTTKAIRESGLEPVFTARKSNAEGIRDSIIEYYKF